jgi:uncharacterized phage protein (TIGR01671 family)
MNEILDKMSIRLFDESEKKVSFENNQTMSVRQRKIKFNNKKVSFSTGIRDRNGILIYQHDIIRLYHEIHFGVYQIELQGAIFCFTPKKGNTEFPFFGNSGDKIEVIGNIYQNIELLEKYSLTY